MTISQRQVVDQPARAMMAAVLGLLIALVSGAASAAPPPAPTLTLERDHPLVGRILQPASGRMLSPAEVVDMVLGVDAVLLGETHDNPDHHALQAWVVAQLAAAGRRPSVAFEMIDSDQQAPLDAHLAAHPADAAGLGAAIDWSRHGWPDWVLYRPIAQAALSAGGVLKAANLTRELTRDVGRNTAPEAAAARLRLTEQPGEAEAAALSEEIKSSHCGMLPDTAVPAMVRIQRARDTEMALALAGLSAMPGAGTAVLIAGAGHVRSDRGVPARLKAVAPRLRPLSVGFIEVRAGETDPAGYAEAFGSERLPFDIVWFTPRAEREDQCAELEKHMQKKKEEAKP
jgi:uncharacterized iron-regulated protein